MVSALGAPLKCMACVVIMAMNFLYVFSSPLLDCVFSPGKNRVLQNFPGKILQFFGLLFLHLLCLENLHGM